MIILFFGQPASGKTTIADMLVNNWGDITRNTIRIDGDVWREITKNKDYSLMGRMSNLKGAFDMALFLERMGFVPVLSFVAPYEDIRQYLKRNAKEFVDIYLTYNEDRGRNEYFAKDFEQPSQCCLSINTSVTPLDECLIKVKMFLQ
jgi:adenylylsulfate kinase